VFSRTAHLYDAIYAFKDYAAEAARLHELIEERVPGPRTLLDIACGTGKHLAELRAWYEVEGVDLDLRCSRSPRRASRACRSTRAT
jgi:ubiquinone/menaquinone biosynthesis C-methylase UbiE